VTASITRQADMTITPLIGERKSRLDISDMFSGRVKYDSCWTPLQKAMAGAEGRPLDKLTANRSQR